MKDVNEHLAHIWAFAAECLGESGSVDTGAVVFTEDDTCHYVPTPPEELKDLYPGAIRLVARLVGAQLAVMISEAWLVQIDADEEERFKGESKDHPARMDVVLVAWVAKDGRQGAARALIHRDGAMPRLGDIVDIGGAPGETTFNRYLDGVFAPPKGAQH